MSNFSNSTRRLSRMAVMAALYTVLAMITIPIGNIHLTLASLPVVLTASLFGPLQGAAVAVVGEFIHQMLTYGFTLTTLLWLVPPALRAAVIGLGVYALKKAGRLPEAKPAFYYALSAMRSRASLRGRSRPLSWRRFRLCCCAFCAVSRFCKRNFEPRAAP